MEICCTYAYKLILYPSEIYIAKTKTFLMRQFCKFMVYQNIMTLCSVSSEIINSFKSLHFNNFDSVIAESKLIFQAKKQSRYTLTALFNPLTRGIGQYCLSKV